MSTSKSFSFVDHLWKTDQVKGLDAVDQLIYRSNILGKDPRITNTRGGNTSGKIIETTADPSGRPTKDFDLNGDGVINRYDLVALGGDRAWLAMTEFTIPFQSPVEIAFFLDAGNSLYEDTSWGLHDYRASAGIELRFFLPVFPVPLRLIYGWPLRKLPEDATSAFTFSIGRSF